MREPSSQPLLENRLDIHDRKQFELKLEYQPSGLDPSSVYFVDTWVFIPSQLNISHDTWPRENIYADIHNYVRLKTPTLSFEEIAGGQHSPLVQLADRLQLGLQGAEGEVVYDAKMLSCVWRGALRRFSRSTHERCVALAKGGTENGTGEKATQEELEQHSRQSVKSITEILARYREICLKLAEKYPLEERT